MFRIGTLAFERPVFLAPMEDVTERPFRRLCRRFGADLVYTEFVSSEGLIRHAAKTRSKIALAEDEHPVGIQLYGNREEALVEAALLSEAVGPDLIDINFGCPAKKVACKRVGVGAGAGLLKEPELLLSLTRAVVRAVRLPVTVKTRMGWTTPRSSSRISPAAWRTAASPPSPSMRARAARRSKARPTGAGSRASSAPCRSR